MTGERENLPGEEHEMTGELMVSLSNNPGKANLPKSVESSKRCGYSTSE
jgi:hypothetical protein